MKKALATAGQKIKKNYFIPLTLAPAFIILGLYTFYPAVESLVLSLYKTRLFSPEKFIGFAHYIKVFSDPIFWQGVYNTMLYSFWSILGTILIGLALAVLLDSRMKGKGFFRAVFFAPYIIPMAAHTTIWQWLYDPRYGLINLILSWFGVEAVPWITSRAWVLPSFIIMDIWKRAGFALVLFTSGLATIPEELYDAGFVDGANSWQRFWHITLPMLSPMMMFSIIISILHTFQLFVEPYVLTKGGPGTSSISIVYIIYQQGFRNSNIGEASAVAVFLFCVIFAITAVIVRKFDVKEL